MAHDTTEHTPGAPAEHAHAHAHHPGWKTYVVVGIILTAITAVEVSAYYNVVSDTRRGSGP